MELLPFCNRKVNKMKKIGVLTSGGDAPGMNAAIRAVVKTAIANGIQPIGFIKGYNGILEKNYRVMDRESVSGIIHSGGTILKTARCMEFYEASYREKAFHNAKEIGLDGLVVIGGDGSYRGAGYLSELGLPCIGVPGTIDNDIASTEYTIGYDTAMNTVVECVDKLNNTCQSHERCSVVEVMGRLRSGPLWNTNRFSSVLSSSFSVAKIIMRKCLSFCSVIFLSSFIGN